MLVDIRDKWRRTQFCRSQSRGGGGFSRLLLNVRVVEFVTHRTRKGDRKKEFVLSRTRAQYKVTELARAVFRC